MNEDILIVLRNHLQFYKDLCDFFNDDIDLFHKFSRIVEDIQDVLDYFIGIINEKNNC